MSGRVEFNFTPEQQERFNLIYAETKKIHPELITDESSKQRVKVLIAYTVINGDDSLKELKDNQNQNQNVFTEIVEDTKE